MSDAFELLICHHHQNSAPHQQQPHRPALLQNNSDFRFLKTHQILCDGDVSRFFTSQLKRAVRTGFLRSLKLLQAGETAVSIGRDFYLGSKHNSGRSRRCSSTNPWLINSNGVQNHPRSSILLLTGMGWICSIWRYLRCRFSREAHVNGR